MPPRRNEQRFLIRLSLAVSGCFALASCYVPTPADPSSITPGGRLSIVLSAEGRERLSEISTRQSDELRGQLVNLTSDSLTIATKLPGPSYASSFSSLRQTLTIGRADIQEVTVPRLHRGRTAAVAAGVLAVATILVLDLLDIGGGGSGGSPDGPPPPPSPLRSRR